MKRTKKKKMTRTRINPKRQESVRTIELLRRNVLCYHKPLRDMIPEMCEGQLLALCHPLERDTFYKKLYPSY